MPHCHQCKQERAVVTKRTIKIPQMSELLTSEKPICDECAAQVEVMVNPEWIEKTPN